MRISSNQYRRLFTVCFIPLMALGFFASKIIFHQSGMGFSVITCAPFALTGTENCRQVGELSGKLYQSVKNEHPAWFDVEVGDFDKDAPLQSLITASTRVLPDVQIVRAETYSIHTPKSASVMASLLGRRAVIKLGIEKRERSFVQDNMHFLYCNGLKFEGKEGTYTSSCFGDGWEGKVTYQAAGYSRNELDKLLSSINRVESQRRSEYNVFRIVMYPIFVYLFLLASIVVFAVSRAIRYVRAG